MVGSAINEVNEAYDRRAHVAAQLDDGLHVDGRFERANVKF